MLAYISKSILFNSSSIKIPIVDLEPFLSGKNSINDCKNVAQSLHKYGCLIVKDPRVKQAENDRFIDILETYFDKRSKELSNNKRAQDIYPEMFYQVGATPEFKQKCRDHSSKYSNYSLQNQPRTPTPAPYDAKWRYFWNMSTDDNVKKMFPNVIPQDFPQFQQIMDSWGNHMMNGCYTVSEMAAIGFGFERNTFTAMLDGGEHKLGPTGSDLERHSQETVFAGFHYDLNFLTIHGKSRYPGLFAWLRTGEKFSVKVPNGHLLVQTGKQFQHITGGYIAPGFHEVIYTNQVRQLKEKAIKEGKIPWRISSTLFSVLRDDIVMKPFGRFYNSETAQKYPPILVKDYIMQQLKDIQLA